MKKTQKIVISQKVEKVAKRSKRVLGGPSSCLKGNLPKKIVKKVKKSHFSSKKP